MNFGQILPMFPKFRLSMAKIRLNSSSQKIRYTLPIKLYDYNGSEIWAKFGPEKLRVDELCIPDCNSMNMVQFFIMGDFLRAFLK